jgi:hypothetical protein
VVSKEGKWKRKNRVDLIQASLGRISRRFLINKSKRTLRRRRNE